MPDQTAVSRSRPSKKLRDILMSDKPTVSYADFHHQITDGYLPKAVVNQQNHGAEVKAEKDELVRYMSNLPSYLEKGKNFQEKPLSVGVLDWRRLEKWTYSNDQVPHKSNGYSSSTSSASYFSTERSSSQSSRGQLSSPMKKVSQDHNQRTYHLVPHSHYQKVYPLEGCSHTVDRVEGVSASILDRGIGQQNLAEKYRNCTVKESGVSLEMHRKKECESNTISDCREQQIRRNSDVISSKKGKLKIRESELKEAMQSRCNPNLGVNRPDCSKERNTVVLLVPRDVGKNKGTAHSSDLKESAIRIPKECGGKSSSELANLKVAHNPVPSSNAPAVNVSSQLKSPSRSRNIEKKPAIVVLRSSTPTRMSGELDSNTGLQPTIKARHPSPIRRLGSAVSNIVRSAGSRDNTPLRRSTSNEPVPDRSQANGRARSSPLRRLLDPLIKPKATSVCESAEPLRKDEHLNLPKLQSVNVKSTFISSKTKSTKDSSPLQALLQVGVNNGLPVFSFAVDNDNDNILAATVSKSEKTRSNWIYTFLSVRGMKKKNALWPNQGCKGKGQYVPNVVAQMPVSNHHTNVDSTREFTLFSVDVGQADQDATEFQPANELAAVVVKLLKPNAIQDTTVILPGGIHTIPSKGSVSTLTERWRSGGSCDCGGWDLGCQLRIFTNQGHPKKLLTAAKSSTSSDEFKLYHQVGQETELVLRANPLKERIYSVEFNSSMSLLQAFGTCVAVLDCKFLSPSTMNVVEGRTSASYVSYPPHSPVSRA